jgi:hypothetical protein
LYAATLFVSAFLLFLVQPIVGKMLLPSLGGTPLAWNTCMVFFQILLLGGYLYAHLTTKWLGVQRQSRMHIILLAVTMVVLALVAVFYKQPIAIDKDLSPQGHSVPIFGILLVLFLAIGVPFFTVSTSAPLLQRWFSKSGHSAAKDPYFLYAASNIGSMLSLVVYPLFIEPSLRLATQSWVWAGGFGILSVLIGLCAVSLPKATAKDTEDVQYPNEPPVAWLTRLRWLALAAVPSCLMLGVTTYLVTDIASIPLLWIFPLGIYLLSFIIAFLRLPKWLCILFGMVAPVGVLFLLFIKFGHTVDTLSTLFVIHIAVFGAVALMCHTELARSRPGPGRLTEFFLLMSAGGVVGGLISTLFAPLIFSDVHEYTIALVAACFLVPMIGKPQSKPISIALDIGFPIMILALAMALTRQSLDSEEKHWHLKLLLPVAEWLARNMNRVFSFTWKPIFPLDVGAVNLFPYLVYGFPLTLSLAAIHRPWRFGLAVAAIAIAALSVETGRDIVLKTRSQFGVLKVTKEEGDGYTLHTFSHGTTTHGDQLLDPLSLEPRTYYHIDGPIGDVFLREFNGPRQRKKLAFIGLGTGTLATYAGKGQQVTYFEIDPVVRRIATDRKYFTYYSDSKADKRILLGDARIQMERESESKYDLIIVDAFSSDSIPIHLLTREAMQLYLNRLEPGGAVLLHVSNRHLELAPVVARHALDMDLQAWHINDSGNDEVSHYSSEWVLVLPAATPTQFVSLPESNWRPIAHSPTDPQWTDDFSSILAVLNWLDDWPWIRKQVRGQ